MDKISPRALLIDASNSLLNFGESQTVESWQGARNQNFKMVELLFFQGRCKIPGEAQDLLDNCQPDMPWAEEHFQERVSGKPTNPGESYKIWPYFIPGSENKTFDRFNGKFFSTYQERFWPKHAGEVEGSDPHKTSQLTDLDRDRIHRGNIKGIRFDYGDLGDVLDLMFREPHTRQAYLPLFFPEDTGVVHGDRAMCSLGYDFIIRNNQLHMSYYMRSADLMRHFKNDIYLAGRLMQWMVYKLREKFFILDREDCYPFDTLSPGTLHVYVKNLHVFESDMYTLDKRGVFRTQNYGNQENDKG